MSQGNDSAIYPQHEALFDEETRLSFCNSYLHGVDCSGCAFGDEATTACCVKGQEEEAADNARQERRLTTKVDKNGTL